MAKSRFDARRATASKASWSPLTARSTSSRCTSPSPQASVRVRTPTEYEQAGTAILQCRSRSPPRPRPTGRHQQLLLMTLLLAGNTAASRRSRGASSGEPLAGEKYSRDNPKYGLAGAPADSYAPPSSRPDSTLDHPRGAERPQGALS